MTAVLRSPRYVDGEFRDLIDTPMLIEGNSVFSVVAGDLFKRFENLRPASPIPSEKTNLKALDVTHDMARTSGKSHIASEASIWWRSTWGSTTRAGPIST